MKTIQNIEKVFLLLILGTILNACEDSIAVDMPQTQLTGDAVYQDEMTATAALSDIYARMRDNGVISGNLDGLSMVMSLYADDLISYSSSSSPLDNFYNHTINPSNENVLSLWSNSYAQIYAANALLEGLSKSSSIPAENVQALRGEALFIRAILHFYLVNLFGDIPYVTSTDYQVNSTVSRLPLNSVYERVILDLLEAKELLPTQYISQERIRANKSVVQALLSRVYLYQEKWTLAELEATDLTNNAIYNLEPDLAVVFLKDNPSTIWQLHPGVAGANTLEGQFFIFNSGPPTIAAASNNLIDAFEMGDLRKENWLQSVTDGSTTWYHPYKYKQNENSGVSQEYSIIFRLEEQFLIRAEARAQQGNLSGAKEDLNKIRNRAGLGNTQANTQVQLLAAIAQERRFEFFTEIGHRWFDLKRTGNAASVLAPIKPTWQNRDLLLPIPETELRLNSNLNPQNPGY